jgi:hypothetical protein
MRRQLVRRRSKSARLAQGTGFFSLLLAVLATLLFRGGILDVAAFLGVLIVAGAIAVLAMLLGLAGLWKLWREGAKAGGASLRGIVLAAATLSPFVAAAVLGAGLPMINDVSTDPANPPEFPIGARQIINAPFGLAEENPDIADLQAEAYPDLSSRIVQAGFGETLDAVNAAAEKLGWVPTSNGGGITLPSGALRAFESRTFIFGFTDDVVVRLLPAGDRIVLDVRSAGRFGKSDLGNNARRIRAFYAALDEVLLNSNRQ